MNTFKIAWRNVVRNSRRTVLSVIAIAFAIFACIFGMDFMWGLLGDMTDNYYNIEYGHIRIMDQEYSDNISELPLDRSMTSSLELEEFLSQKKEVKKIYHRIKFGAILGVGNQNIPVLGIGIDPENEIDTLRLKDDMLTAENFNEKTHQSSFMERIFGEENARKIMEMKGIEIPESSLQLTAESVAGGKYLETDDDIIIGIRLASEQGIKVGDKINVISGSGGFRGKTFTVAGIYSSKTPSLDNNFIFITRNAAKEFLKIYGYATETLVLIDKPNKAPELARLWQNEYKQLNPAEGQYLYFRPWQKESLLNFMVSFAQLMYYIIFIVVILLACSIIVNMMMMVVYERMQEIGMMRALGMQDKDVMIMLLTESGFIGLIGSTIGMILGLIVTVTISKVGLNFGAMAQSMDFPINTTIYTKGSLSAPFIFLITGTVMTVITTYFPIREGIKRTPADAMRTLN